MVDQELQVVTSNNKHFIIKLLGFFLSFTILYFMIIWTLELSRVEIDDLPVISVLDKDFKKLPPINAHTDIENLDLSINILKEGNLIEDYGNSNIKNNIEPNLLDEEEVVSLDMKKSLQNSISNALKSLEKQEFISSEKSFYLYLGTFSNQKSADNKLIEINKVSDFKSIPKFSIIKELVSSKKIFSIRSNEQFLYEKASDYCEAIISINLECKIIAGL